MLPLLSYLVQSLVLLPLVLALLTLDMLLFLSLQFSHAYFLESFQSFLELVLVLLLLVDDLVDVDFVFTLFLGFQRIHVTILTFIFLIIASILVMSEWSVVLDGDELVQLAVVE